MRAARYGGLATYQAIAQLMHMPLTGGYMAKETGQILGEIAEDEVTNGRPMLSAVAVGISGLPGHGFYALARDLGRLQGDSPGQERAFWEAEKAAVYEAWKRTFVS